MFLEIYGEKLKDAYFSKIPPSKTINAFKILYSSYLLAKA